MLQRSLHLLMPCRAGLLGAVLFTFLQSLCSTSCHAQIEGKLASQPLGIAYARDLTEVELFEYVEQLTKRLELEHSFLPKGVADRIKERASKVDEPIAGASWYLVQGLLPSFETIYFRQVVDEDDARRLLEARGGFGRSEVNVEVEGPGQFKLNRKNSYTQKPPEGQDAAKIVEGANKKNRRRRRGHYQTAELTEEDGKEVIKYTWNNIEYFRLRDDFLFSSNFEELWDMELPSKKAISGGRETENDAGFEVFFDRVPAVLRELGWNMLNSTAGVQMQQRDGEEQTIADLRQATLSFGVDAVKGILLDVEDANGWAQFATEDEQSVRAELKFNARRNSELTEQLKELSTGRSRFAPIIRDQAAATIHVCIRMSDAAEKVPRAAADWFRQIISANTSENSELVDAAAKLSDSLNGIAEHQTIEAIAKIGWTEESGSAFYGGIQVDKNPELLGAVFQMAHEAVSRRIGSANEHLQIVEIDGEQFIRFEVPQELVENHAKLTSLTLSHVYITHQNSCLWFAVGGENAVEILHQSVASCQATRRASRTALVTANIDVDQWMDYPEDDETGISRLLSWLDENVHGFPPNPWNRPSTDEKPTPLIDAVSDLGGNRDAHLSILADKSGVQVSLDVGEMIANYMLARGMDAQGRVRASARKRRQEAREQRKKAAEEAKSN